MFRRWWPDLTTLVAVGTQGIPTARGLHGSRRVLALLLLLGLPVASQSPGMPARTSGGERVSTAGASDSDSGLDARMEAKRMTALNVARQKSMVSDADKLLQLARELHDDADAGGTKMSSAQRLHKAGEIERLAKDVKNKMVFTIGTPDPFAGPFAIFQH